MNVKNEETKKYEKYDAKSYGEIVSRTDALYGEFARLYGLNYNSLGVYLVIYENQPCTQKSVCNEWGLSKQTVNSICKELHKNGMIEYEKNETDKREKLVRLTEKGENFIEPVISKLREMENEVLDEMSPECRYWLFRSNKEFYEMFSKKMKEVDNNE